MNLEHLSDVYIFYFSYHSEGRCGIYFYLGVVFALVIVRVLQQLKERKLDMPSKFYSPRERSFVCNVTLTYLSLSGESGLKVTAHCVSLSFHPTSARLPQQVKWGIIYGGERI